MRNDKATIRCGTRMLTKPEAEAALEHANAFILLAVSLDEKNYGVSAREWRDRYYGSSVIPETSGYDNDVDFKALEKDAGIE